MMCPVIMERRGSPYRMLPSRLPGSEIAGALAGVEFRNNNAYGSKVYLSAFTEKTKQRLALSSGAGIGPRPVLGTGHSCRFEPCPLDKFS